jgi:hypothetical protein
MMLRTYLILSKPEDDTCLKDLHSPCRPLGWCPFSFALKPKSGFGIQIKCAIALVFLWVFNIVIISVDGADGK